MSQRAGLVSYLFPLSALAAVLLAGSSTPADELTLDERVRALETVERVRYGHRLGPSRAFEEAVPRTVLESKVRDTLAGSAALEQLWNRSVTDELLRRELSRIEAGTRLPDRLQALYDALGNDPSLIRETLARPALVERLTRALFATDRRIHADARRAAETLRAGLTAGTAIDVEPLAYGYRLAERDEALDALPPLSDLARDGQAEFASLPVAPEKFQRLRARFESFPGGIGPVVERPGAFEIEVVRSIDDRELRIERYRIDKISWDDWWRETRGDFTQTAAVSSAAASTLGTSTSPSPDGPGDDGARVDATESVCLPDDLWAPTSTSDDPVGRRQHTAVWTGNRMIVWGGLSDTQRVASGAAYDPVLDLWTTLSTSGAPSPRAGHTAVWTGDRMIVWGGLGPNYQQFLDTGATYDPATDRWTPLATTGAPGPRSGHTATWTESEMIVWGGAGAEGGEIRGARYDPAADGWTPMDLQNNPAPRVGHTATWTGSELIVWGGHRPSDEVFYEKGGRYDPVRDRWTVTSTNGIPAPRGYHTAVWTGTRVIVWGGWSNPNNISQFYNDGALYNPQNNKWTLLSTAGAPDARSNHSAAWTGNAMVIWGGDRPSNLVAADGGRYDPAADAWSTISADNAPVGRGAPTTVWTGTEMIVWGGEDEFAFDVNSGGRYDPTADSWTPTAVTSSAPTGRRFQTAVWTGNEMIVWGGDAYPNTFNSGARYDPLLDTWTPTSTINAPVPRTQHMGAWAAGRMVVWGGFVQPTCADTGGSYDPITDSWQTTSMTNVPQDRCDATMVSTGDRVIVWGGERFYGFLNSGGVYDPVADSWQAVSTVAAPAARRDHTAVWAGSEMIVWGGDVDSQPRDPFNTGGRYDPSSNQWSPTAAVTDLGAELVGRRDHAAVWTGSEMIVWGGDTQASSVDGGGSRYDPVADTWSSLSEIDEPIGRHEHTAVWTGSLMVVWGGLRAAAPTFGQDGGRYDPARNSWTSTMTDSPPEGRISHSAVWAGSEMVVWGGIQGSTFFASGGAYDPADADLDGVSDACDCAPDDPGAVQAPGEVGGLIFDADRTTLVWDSASGTAGTGTVYDVLRGAVAELPVGSGTADQCLASETPAASIADGTLPPAGDGFWYLVRARNVCGIGSYGFTTASAERVATACP